jgi:lycopene elongase/hydratase (dihydrobisanhydrobacterioruberin-forming)
MAMSLKHLPKLILNHMDAWGVTLIIGIVALVVHPPFRLEHIGVPLILAFCYWLGFAVNDYFDAPFDGQDIQKGRKNFFVQVPLTRAQVGVTFGVLSLVLGLLFFHFGLNALIVVVSGLFAIWAYSAPPLRLKSRPGFDLLMHMIFVQTFPFVATITLLGLAWTRLDAALISIFVMTSLSAQLEQQIRDYAVDLQTDHNFTTTVGAPASAFLLKLISGTLIVLAIFYILAGIIPTYLVPFALFFLPLLIHRFFRGSLSARPELLGRIMLIAALLYTGYVSTSGLFSLR